MPTSGSAWRGEQLSLLARSIHARQSSDHFQSLLQEAKVEFKEKSLSKKLNQEEIFEHSRNVELLEQDFNRQKALDPDLISHLAIAKSNGYKSWQEAKAKSDYNYFAPHLKKLIFLRQEEARQLSESRSSWETLAQVYEPDITINRLKELFHPLRRKLPDLLDISKNNKNLVGGPWDIDDKSQEELSKKLLDQWARDKKNSAISRSPHPFSITLGPDDFRLTTRVVKGHPLSCLLASAHEWGHSLYEQGLPSKTNNWFAWPLGQATSMGVHESQSLFWENRVARSLEFSERFWPDFVSVGAPFENPKDCWLAMNPLAPGLNRVEADELSYGLHIIIRTDLEIALIDGELDVNDLPHEWNASYEKFLGVTPRNDSEGCLQDVHWSEGAFGYFPSYLLGHLISAQISEAMTYGLRETGISGEDPIGTCIKNRDESTLINWLRKEVHCVGKKMNGEELVEKVSGKKLSSHIFLNYLEKKLELLSGNS